MHCDPCVSLPHRTRGPGLAVCKRSSVPTPSSATRTRPSPPNSTRVAIPALTPGAATNAPFAASYNSAGMSAADGEFNPVSNGDECLRAFAQRGSDGIWRLYNDPRFPLPTWNEKRGRATISNNQNTSPCAPSAHSSTETDSRTGTNTGSTGTASPADPPLKSTPGPGNPIPWPRLLLPAAPSTPEHHQRSQRCSHAQPLAGHCPEPSPRLMPVLVIPGTVPRTADTPILVRGHATPATMSARMQGAAQPPGKALAANCPCRSRS